MIMIFMLMVRMMIMILTNLLQTNQRGFTIFLTCMCMYICLSLLISDITCLLLSIMLTVPSHYTHYSSTYKPFPHPQQTVYTTHWVVWSSSHEQLKFTKGSHKHEIMMTIVIITGQRGLERSCRRNHIDYKGNGWPIWGAPHQGVVPPHQGRSPQSKNFESPHEHFCPQPG